MKPEFHEDFDNPEHDPLSEGSVDFDMAAVERGLGESPCYVRDLAVVIGAIYSFATKGIDCNRDSINIIGRRFMALMWVVNPQLIKDSPSAQVLAGRLGIPRVVFARMTGRVSKHFGITNRAQAHAWNRGKAKPVNKKKCQ